MGKRIAVLMTCYNRVQATLACLESLFAVELTLEFALEVFLVDDHSPDETGKIVKLKFPQINLIQGSGNLFWAKGMRLAWEQSNLQGEFDYFLWLNDDTILHKNAIQELIEVNSEYKYKNKVNITFGFCSSMHGNEITYGGIRNKNFLIPNGKPQKADMINGNIVLVPRLVFKMLGNLSEKYTHGMADYDYSLRAKENGIHCISTKNVVAKCDRNIDIFTHNKFSVKYKFNHLYKILTNKYIKFRFDEYCYFRKRFFSDSTFYIYVKFIVYNISKIIMSTSLK